MFDLNDFDRSDNVDYHYGEFPPSNLPIEPLLSSLLAAQEAISRYDQMLKMLPNSQLLLAPLLNQEAVISSRIEGTISTVDELMVYQAEEGNDDELDDIPKANSKFRNDIIEVGLYSMVLKRAQSAIIEGTPINENLIKNSHKMLLSFGRGTQNFPGEYKSKQNYIGDKRKRTLLFTPISPLHIQSSMEVLLNYIESRNDVPLIKVAVSHVEFEALHPFNDGNGRIGRLLVTLLLWKYGLIHKPHFYLSGFLEENKDVYIDMMRNVSKNGDWTEWCGFFLTAIKFQAERNLETATKISNLYEEMKVPFRELTSSKWAITAQDYIFQSPIFLNVNLTNRAGIPKNIARRISKVLVENNLLREVRPASGRQSAMYAFEDLMRIVRV